MKRISLFMLFPLALLLTTAVAYGQTPKDVPDIAQREILRRGDLVELLGSGYREDGQALFTEAMQPPADDSHKWFISVIRMQNCRYCELLKRDFATSPHLKPFVDVNDHSQSWSHYNVYQIEDETQAWRWQNVKLTAFPTVLVQPPRSGQFGDCKTVVLQLTGYDGDAKKLADTLRRGIANYVSKYAQQRTQVIGQSDRIPFVVPPKVNPLPLPFDPTPDPTIPPVPQPAPQPAPSVNLLSILLTALGGTLSSGGLTNMLLLALAALAVMRTFRKATGQKLLMDDTTFQQISDALRNLIQPQTPNNNNQ